MAKQAKNIVGQLYDNAPKVKKLAFRLSLMQSGETDRADYVKRFRDHWQYAETVGAMPYAMVFAAIEHLNFQPNQTRLHA